MNKNKFVFAPGGAAKLVSEINKDVIQCKACGAEDSWWAIGVVGGYQVQIRLTTNEDDLCDVIMPGIQMGQDAALPDEDDLDDDDDEFEESEGWPDGQDTPEAHLAQEEAAEEAAEDQADHEAIIDPDGTLKAMRTRLSKLSLEDFIKLVIPFPSVPELLDGVTQYNRKQVAHALVSRNPIAEIERVAEEQGIELDEEDDIDWEAEQLISCLNQCSYEDLVTMCVQFGEAVLGTPDKEELIEIIMEWAPFQIHANAEENNIKLNPGIEFMLSVVGGDVVNKLWDDLCKEQDDPGNLAERKEILAAEYEEQVWTWLKEKYPDGSIEVKV